jgi:hypothetical protein
MQTFKQFLGEDLRQWFKQKWVRMDTKGNIKGDCAREPGEGKPKCLPQAKAHALGKEGRAAAARRKRREDPNPERRGAPINVKTESVEEACWTGYTQKGMKKKGDRMVPNCVPEETVTEKWTEKYKRSINCDNPKGFSQRAHCQGKKKSVNEDGMGGAIGSSAGPTNVTGVATSTDPISATAVNRKKRKSPVMLTIRRKSPKV